jgi:hypothetical protein
LLEPLGPLALQGSLGPLELPELLVLTEQLVPLAQVSQVQPASKALLVFKVRLVLLVLASQVQPGFKGQPEFKVQRV